MTLPLTDAQIDELAAIVRDENDEDWAPAPLGVLRRLIDEIRQSRSRPAAVAPIPMVLHCPACGLQHIDAPEQTPQFDNGMGARLGGGHWTNPPHRSHLCHGCGHIWRPADVPTEGVATVQTTGKADSPITVPPPPPVSDGWRTIETAPKDGTWVLTCIDTHYLINGFVPQTAYWGAYHPNAPGDECWRNSSRHKLSAPTHWAPLVAPPSPIPGEKT